RKPLSSMHVEDCNAYLAFLEDPAPKERWCGPKNVERWSVLWRPFTGKLKRSGQRQAGLILKSFYSFLVKNNYLVGNPWSSVRVPKAPNPEKVRGRSLTKAQWDYVLQ